LPSIAKKPYTCDACDKRIRPIDHELRLSDLTTGQHIGKYHTYPACHAAAAKYFEAGRVLHITVLHPNRCGDEPHFDRCNGALPGLLAVKR